LNSKQVNAYFVEAFVPYRLLM